MCLILLAYRCHPRYHLVVAANRDEFFGRPAAAAHWWGGEGKILAGRDLEAGGTWMGISRLGRFAALTNYRDPPAHRQDAPSRGALVCDYLEGSDSPADYLESLASRAADYNGFNLLVGDRDGLLGYCNRAAGIRSLEPGVHGISNGILDEPWPKVSQGRAELSAVLSENEEPDPERLFAILADRARADDELLPDTGIGKEWERMLSARFIAAPGYGTRCSTILLWGIDGRVRFIERSFDETGKLIGVVDHSFRIENPKVPR
ncbi:MAG: NRDE family protein [Gammaproteobacteria bacterium]